VHTQRQPAPDLGVNESKGTRTDVAPPTLHSPKRSAVGLTSSERGWALRLLRSRELVLVLVGLGVLLQIAQYLANRSLWVDEAWLSLNLIDRPLSGLTTTLDFQQAAPLGFLLIEGSITKVLGYSEYALRLFPLACGLVSIPVFAWLARRILSTTAAPFAILLFVVSDGLIYYSSEVKPYETDVAVAVCFLGAGILLAEEEVGRTRALLIAAGGLALVTLSFAAVFVVAAVAGVLTVRLLSNRRRHLLSPASLAVLLWGCAAIGIAIFGLTRGRLVRGSFEDSGRFLGVGGSSSPLHAVNVMGTQIATAMGLPQQRPFSHVEKLALLCALVGAVALLRRDRTRFWMLIAPLALLLGASAAHVYPILKRTELFLVPIVILFIAEGVAQVVRWLPGRAQLAAAFLLPTILVAGPLWLAGERLIHPRTNEEIRPVLEYVRDHWRPGDTLYVHYGAQYALLYYEECNCLRLSAPGTRRQLWPLRALRGQKDQFGQAAVPLSSDVVIGRYHGSDSRQYLADLDRIRRRHRVWFLYSHVGSDSEESFIRDDLLGHLASLGTRIGGIDRPGAHADLYQLNASRSARTAASALDSAGSS
jgi:dolichyl-phosphate-mannose-protein mannosyltransferase